VRFAGFTPAADLAEVRDRPTQSRNGSTLVQAPAASSSSSPYRTMQPVFTLGGLSPAVADLFAPQFSALGLNAIALGGSTQGNANPAADGASAKLGAPTLESRVPTTLQPGGAVAVALATGDISLAGTGTVSRVDGNKITAFGHPMLSLGDVELPMCAAEIVTILPSQMSSMKIANTGAVIGTITQDRLSAVSGTLGAGPAMVDVEVTVKTGKGANRTLKFSVVREQSLTPVVVATGVSQAILGSNDAGLASGFKLSSNIAFSDTHKLGFDTLYSGPQGFTQGLNEFVQGLAANLQNPYEKTFPSKVSFSVEPLVENPSVTLEMFQLSRSTIRAGQTAQLTLAWRDWQGDTHREVIDIPVDAGWTGRQLEVVMAPGRTMDELTGRPRVISASELRSFDAYLAAMKDDRPTHGVTIAVVERTSLFTDQTVATTADAPGSIERIARASDEARFRKREAFLPLWEKHVLGGKLLNATVRRPLSVVE
jgi:hypothetical protein